MRCRPFSDKERENGHTDVVQVNPDAASVVIHNPQTKDTKSFTFDSAFDSNSKQIDVYNITARPIVDSVLEGYNGTIFAYGQTGTGKVVPNCESMINYADIYNGRNKNRSRK